MVKIFFTEDEGQVEAGTIDLSGKKLEIEANEGYEDSMEHIKEFVCVTPDLEEVTSDDPKRWLELLPDNLSGSYMRAVSVE